MTEEINWRDVKGKTIECVQRTTIIEQHENLCENKSEAKTTRTVLILFTDGTRITLSSE